jgi:hypothetical protein
VNGKINYDKATAWLEIQGKKLYGEKFALDPIRNSA